MVETIFYGAIMAVEAMIAWIYCERLFDRKRKLWALILAYAVTYTLHFFVSLAGNTTINCICFCLFNFVLFFFGYQVKCRSAILHAGFLCFIMLMAELLVSLVINLFGYDFAEYTHNRLVLFTLGIWSKLLYLILAVFCARLFSPHKYENEEPRFFALFCVLPIVSAFLCTAIVYIGIHSEVNQTVGTMMTINIAALLAMNLLFFSIYHHIQKMHAEQLQTRLRMQKEENDALYYQTLQEQADSQRILIHDIKNHMHAIKRLAEQCETEAISAYLSQMDKTILSLPKTRLCNEPVLNGLLLRFADDCKKAGVSFSCDIRDNCLASMDPVSVTALFGNLLSNALEAASVSKAKEIELSVRYSMIQYAVIIAVSNACDQAPTPDAEGSYVTRKIERNLHGIGLKSIARVVEKYHGLSATHYNAERNVFYHFIHIPYQSEN